MGPDIFISYSSADRAVARRFAERFESEGFRVWWDAALHSGQTFDEVIEAELRAAKAVVVLWSPRSVTSRWVRAEATLADRQNKLVPAIIEPCERPIIFELTHTVDLSHWTGDAGDAAWLAFLHDVRQAVARTGPLPASAVKPPFGASPVEEPAGDSEPESWNAPGGDQLVLARPAAKVEPRTRAPRRLATAPVTAAAKFDALADEFHCLEQMVGERMEKRFVVSPSGLRIGRTAPSDIVLPDPRVSRVHCLVELADDRLQVSDLNSTNGTFIDGKRVHGRAFLNLGSVVRVGDALFHHALRRRAEALQH